MDLTTDIFIAGVVLGGVYAYTKYRQQPNQRIPVTHSHTPSTASIAPESDEENLNKAILRSTKDQQFREVFAVLWRARVLLYSENEVVDEEIPNKETIVEYALLNSMKWFERPFTIEHTKSYAIKNINNNWGIVFNTEHDYNLFCQYRYDISDMKKNNVPIDSCFIKYVFTLAYNNPTAWTKVNPTEWTTENETTYTNGQLFLDLKTKQQRAWFDKYKESMSSKTQGGQRRCRRRNTTRKTQRHRQKSVR